MQKSRGRVFQEEGIPFPGKESALSVWGKEVGGRKSKACSRANHGYGQVKLRTGRWGPEYVGVQILFIYFTDFMQRSVAICFRCSMTPLAVVCRASEEEGKHRSNYAGRRLLQKSR